jgi:LytR cell envelope-related transcriptional attenuator
VTTGAVSNGDVAEGPEGAGAAATGDGSASVGPSPESPMPVHGDHEAPARAAVDAAPGPRVRAHPRPASRRGRAFTRGRPARSPVARLGAPDGGDAEVAEWEVPPAHLRRHPRLTTSRARRRRTVLLTGMAVFTAAGIGLATAGLTTVRHSTAGRFEEAIAPDEPGYQAHVIPTPTMGVLHRAADGSLAGAWLLALEPGDDGGTVIVVPPSTLVPAAGDSNNEATIADVYRDQGPEAATDALGRVVTVGVSEHVELDDARWGQLVAPVGSVEVGIDAPVAEWDTGRVVLEPDEVGRFLSVRAGGETDLHRVERQQAFWDAWLRLVATGSDTLPGEVGTGIGRFVQGIAGGEGTAAQLPVASVSGQDGTVYRPADDQVRDFVSRTVAYPTAAGPGGRIRVRLLNGTSDPDLTPRMARTLVAGGAEIVIAGNASSFDVTATRLVPADAAREPFAILLTGGLGGGRVGAPPTGQDGQVADEDDVDVTVILGQDAEDLIER